ncbi:hypothetical protein GSbR_21070 [Geobacter sp. SVR]|nr:phosphatidylglycerophosphatase B [Geobacter sp. SVR]GCF85507.1 hypothetical protein GSbR_21070 [Geobacter sp. SVR]
MLLIAVIPVALVTYYCIGHLDRGISLRIQHYHSLNDAWNRHLSAIPDTLFIFTVLLTIGAYTYFRRLISRGVIDTVALTWKMLAIAAPLSFLVKSVLKYVFGRIPTRVWLLPPHDYSFHWLAEGASQSGFPSGHMLVFTALIAIWWRSHPRCRAMCFLALSLLALALIATNYHFLSDVIAGAYIGLVVAALTFRIAGMDADAGRF